MSIDVKVLGRGRELTHLPDLSVAWIAAIFHQDTDLDATRPQTIYAVDASFEGINI